MTLNYYLLLLLTTTTLVLQRYRQSKATVTKYLHLSFITELIFVPSLILNYIFEPMNADRSGKVIKNCITVLKNKKPQKSTGPCECECVHILQKSIMEGDRSYFRQQMTVCSLCNAVEHQCSRSGQGLLICDIRRFCQQERAFHPVLTLL